MDTGLAQVGLIDELQLILNPVVLGAATSLLASLPERVAFSLAEVQKFDTAKILLTYR